MNETLIVPDWPAPARVRAYTSTRLAGQIVLPATLRVPVLKQVHGATVVDAAGAADGVEADACFSRDPLSACQVVTADCLPLLVCDRGGNELAAIHAGWRGLAAGVIEATLAQLQSAPEDLLVWLGPAISQQHYQVGAEVRDQFLAALGPAVASQVDACFLPAAGGPAAGDPAAGRYYADLPAIARIRLAGAGVKQVSGGDRCTWRESQLFYSYRREGAEAGRMTSIIYLDPR